MNLKDTYNQIAEDWHRDHQRDDWWVEGIDKFVALFKKGSIILDVGCGAGTKTKYLIAKGLQVVGIDFSEKMIEIVKREVPAGRFLVMDIHDMEKLEKKFDGILMQAVLLHFPKKEISMVLKNLIGKLKTGGYIFVSVKETKGVEEAIKKEEDYGYPYERFFSYFTSDEIKKYLKELGAEIVYDDVTPYGNTRWIQVIGQKYL